jgi:hypothetical protein
MKLATSGSVDERARSRKPYHSKDSLTGIFLLLDELKRHEAALLGFAALALHRR